VDAAVRRTDGAAGAAQAGGQQPAPHPAAPSLHPLRSLRSTRGGWSSARSSGCG
jgi:hypothetical protein